MYILRDDDNDIFREPVGACSTQVRELASNILELIGEGLGVGAGYFRDELSQQMLLSVNYYPPCPEPNLTPKPHNHFT